MNKDKKKKGKLKYIIGGIVLVLIIVFIVTSCHGSENPDIEEDYNVAFTVSKQDMSETINASGSIQSDAITTVTSDLTGQKVTGVYVEVGDTVTKGQKIATVDVTELKNDLADMKKAYNKEQKQLKDAYDTAVANTDDKEDALDIKQELKAIKSKEKVDIEKYLFISSNAQTVPARRATAIAAAGLNQNPLPAEKNSLSKKHFKVPETDA